MDTRERYVIAAVDDSATAAAVLDVARHVAPLFSAGVEALHVFEDRDGATAAAAAAARDVPLRSRRGDPVAGIVDAAGAPGVAGVVVGSRGVAAGRRPAGHVACEVICAVDKPVVVVPPDAERERPVRRLLLPLDGTGATTRSLRRFFAGLAGRPGAGGYAAPEVVALHVLDPEHLPMFGDQLTHEAEAWAREFLDRFAPLPPPRVRLELRVGAPAPTVRAFAAEAGADLVAACWHRHLDEGRAAVVHALLGEAPVPVLLLPAAGDDGNSCGGAGDDPRGDDRAQAGAGVSSP